MLVAIQIATNRLLRAAPPNPFERRIFILRLRVLRTLVKHPYTQFQGIGVPAINLVL